jgi:SNF2 family DNA or RNA helicase
LTPERGRKGNHLVLCRDSGFLSNHDSPHLYGETVVEYLALVQRRRRLLSSSKKAEKDLDAAQLLVRQSRRKAAVALHRLEKSHGHGALPNSENPSSEDLELISALDEYDHIRRTVEVPLEEAIHLWKQGLRARQQVRTFQNILRALFLSSARTVLARELVAAETCLKATTIVLKSKLTKSLLEKAASHTSTPNESLLKYRHNNAAFIAALERVQTLFDPSNDSKIRGSQGGLPTEIAIAVENTPLLTGPLSAALRRYQSFGARYLILQERALLGDDMGLGKTVQVLAAFSHLHALGARRFLVVAPNSVIINWCREVEKHTHLQPILVHGPEREQRITKWRIEGGVAITTYATLPKLLPSIDAVDYFAADEAHMAKNPLAIRSQAVASIAERSRYVALMTGTALENRLSELQYLIEVVQPELMPELNQIINHPSGRVDPDEVVRALAPSYLRRTQSDVLTELPERVEIHEWVDLSEADLQAYVLARSDMMSKRLAINVGDGTKTSAKYERLREILDEHIDAGRKVVVFSYFRQTIDDVSALAGDAPKITGDTAGSQRQRIIDDFSRNPTLNVLVSQIEAGGLGINLQAAQVVILMEAQFKPSIEWQAIARVHRMGQSRSVMVHRLLARNTIEERLVQLIEEKTQIFRQFAHESSVRDASLMATDTSGNFEADLQRILDEES